MFMDKQKPEIKKKEKPKTKEQILKDVNKFKDNVLEKYKERIKCVVMMGSVVRGEFKAKSDVDVFVVIDDTSEELTRKQKAEIDDDLDDMAKKISKDISVQPSYTLTEFWDYARVCHPIIYNFIKEGEALYDAGFFGPIKKLLKMGKIPATREAIESYMEDAPKKLMRAKTVKLLMLAEDCYYAMLNTGQAVLMFMGVEPPVPSKICNEMKKYLVEPGLLDQEYVDWLQDIIDIRKKIEHKELMDATGAFVDEKIERSEKFIDKMFQLLSALEFRKKEKILERTHEVMYKAAIAALKTLHKEPKKQEDVPEVFKKEFIDTKLVGSYYWDIWKRIEVMKDLAGKDKLDKVPDKDVYQMREHIRGMIRDLAKVLKKQEKKDKK